jgi:dTDP-4-dehydrorhamnose 3,5-epimerase
MTHRFSLRPIGLAGAFEIQPAIAQDVRGAFVKTVHRTEFHAQGLRADFSEVYYTVSRLNVLRGMHCQVPPHHHAKLVYCLAGGVLDVVVDLRLDSPNYRQFATLSLSANTANMVYIPPGCAHGFLVLNAPAILVYHVTSEHCPAADAGIRWDSFGFAWPIENPHLSPRDAALPGLAEFVSPFRMSDAYAEK